MHKIIETAGNPDVQAMASWGKPKLGGRERAGFASRLCYGATLYGVWDKLLFFPESVSPSVKWGQLDFLFLKCWQVLARM